MSAPRPEGMSDESDWRHWPAESQLARIADGAMPGPDDEIGGCITRQQAQTLISELSRLRADGATLKVRADEAFAAHSASFGALSTLSAALFDGEVGDYAALAEKIIARVKQAEVRAGDARGSEARAIKMRDYWNDVAKTLGPQLFEANRRCEQLESDGATLRERVRKLPSPLSWHAADSDGEGCEAHIYCAWCGHTTPADSLRRDSLHHGTCLWGELASAPKEPTP